MKNKYNLKLKLNFHINKKILCAKINVLNFKLNHDPNLILYRSKIVSIFNF